MRRYLFAMGIRTLAFPVAVWAFTTQRYTLAWIAAILAAVIPSFAVMLANAVDRRQVTSPVAPVSPTLRLGPATDPADVADGPAPETPAEGPSVIQGTVVRDTPQDPRHRAAS